MSSKLFNYNGNLIDPDTPIFHATNRGVAYGDGLFETIRMIEGSIPFLSSHYNRLLKGMSYLGFDIPKTFTQAFLKAEIKKVSAGNSRIRITLTRTKGGKYLPTINNFNYLIESESLGKSEFELNSKGKRIDIFKREYLTCTPLSNLKTCNSLPYILASQFYKAQGNDDALLLNEYGRVCEASSSNIFLVKQHLVTTPPLSEGCIEGVTRKFVLEMLEENKIRIEERPITVKQVTEADEIWLTNSIQGIQWVESMKEHQYTNKLAQQAVDWLNAAV